MQPLVSIIVPVYNTEAYLRRCLDSLSRQSLKNIEILLIDDGSTDRCGEICEEYAVKDSRYKVLHHSENRGASAARNTGVRQAEADYVMFADSDDWVHEDFCKDAYECAMRNNADLVMFGYQYIPFNSAHNASRNVCNTVSEGPRTMEEAVNLSLKSFGSVPVNKLYGKKLFEGICYPEGHIFEDTATSYKIIRNANSIYCMNQVLYYRFLRPGSTTIRKLTRSMVCERFKVYWQRHCDLCSWGFHSEQQNQFIIRAALDYCIQTPMDCPEPYYPIAAEILQNAKSVPPRLTWRRKFLMKLFRQSPKIFNLVCALWDKQV